jgi:DNA-binding winged helix-turn-helix (wHTH) protein
MRLVFGNFLFDSDTRQVLRNGSVVHLSPKAFLLLELLLQRGPRAVSKQEIHERLWPGIFVSSSNLANLVLELRAALGDDAGSSRVLRTVPRFGYAFVAEATAPKDKGARRPVAPFVCRLVWGPQEIALDPGENLIGRDRESVVWIDDASVSRRHARISVDEREAKIEDLGSKNGTFVRGERIDNCVRLTDRDAIRIGPASMIFRLFRRTGSTASTVEEPVST